MSSSLKKLLIATPGEIAVSVAQSVADLSVATAVIHPEVDTKSLLVGMIDEGIALQDTGATSYIAMRDAATRHDMTRVHPHRDRR